jgi:hypothetical protein
MYVCNDGNLRTTNTNDFYLDFLPCAFVVLYGDVSPRPSDYETSSNKELQPAAQTRVKAKFFLSQESLLPEVGDTFFLVPIN